MASLPSLKWMPSISISTLLTSLAGRCYSLMEPNNASVLRSLMMTDRAPNRESKKASSNSFAYLDCLLCASPLAAIRL